MYHWNSIPLVLLLLAVFVPTKVTAEEPYIIPEELQRLAIEYDLTTTLDINWQDADLNDVGRYTGVLATVAIIAEEIARWNGREPPADRDYLAALAVSCNWGNKPPQFTSEEQQLLYEASYNSQLRELLPNSLGKLAYTLPAAIAGKEGNDLDQAIKGSLPANRDAYMAYVLNAEYLRRMLQ